MAAQTIVIEYCPLVAERIISKGMSKAAEKHGVTKVEVIRERNLLVVSGRVDCIELTKSLRKIFGFARVVSVTPIASTSEADDFRQQPRFYNYPAQYNYQLPYNE